MYRIIATTHDGFDTTCPEVLGEAYGRLYADDIAAAGAIDAARDALACLEDAEDYDGVILSAIEDSAMDDRVAHALSEIELPDGVSIDHEWVEEVDGDGAIDAVVIRLAVEAGVTMTSAEWEALEEAIDLSGAGLTFHDAGGLGGPWLEGGTQYSSGTYQRWEA